MRSARFDPWHSIQAPEHRARIPDTLGVGPPTKSLDFREAHCTGRSLSFLEEQTVEDQQRLLLLYREKPGTGPDGCHPWLPACGDREDPNMSCIPTMHRGKWNPQGGSWSRRNMVHRCVTHACRTADRRTYSCLQVSRPSPDGGRGRRGNLINEFPLHPVAPGDRQPGHRARCGGRMLINIDRGRRLGA